MDDTNLLKGKLVCSVIKDKGDIKPFIRKRLTTQEENKRAFVLAFEPKGVNYGN
ncbi:MAG: hypothetical protein ACTSYW_00535 [Candidatus Heimdallarchaeota archaeon]